MVLILLNTYGLFYMITHGLNYYRSYCLNNNIAQWFSNYDTP